MFAWTEKTKELESKVSRYKKKYANHPFLNGPMTSASLRCISESTDDEPSAPVESLTDISDQIERTSVSSTTEEESSGCALMSYKAESLSVDETTSQSDLEVLDNLQHLEPLPVFDKVHPRLPPANRQGRETVRLRTNMFPLKIDPHREIYRYDVSVDLLVVSADRGEKVVALNRGPKDDSEVTRRSETIREALRQALAAYRILSESGMTVFDGTNIMFSNENLAVALKPHGESLTIPIGQLPDQVRDLIVSKDAKEIRVTIRPCTEPAHRFTLGAAEKRIASGETDRPLRQFFEILTNEEAIKKNSYVFYGSGKGYLKSDHSSARRDIGFGHERRQGFTKGVRFVEGPSSNPDGRLVTALVLDAKIGTFYKKNKLLDTIAELNKWNSPAEVNWDAHALKRTNTYLRGLRLQILNSKTTFVCSGLDLTDKDDSNRIEFRSLQNCEEKLPGTTILTPSIEKYRALGIDIQFANWPVVVQRKVRGEDFYFPIELLGVCPYQRVPLSRALVEPDKAKKPDERWNLINCHLQELDLARSDSILAGFGVSVDTNPLRTTGFRRTAPKIEYAAHQKAIVDTKKSTWKMNHVKFTDGAKIDQLIVAYNGFDGNQGRPRQGEDADSVLNEVKQFLPNFLSTATKRGLKILENYLEPRPTLLADEMKSGQLFQRIVLYRKQQEQNGEPFTTIVIFIDPEENRSHGYLKFLESKHQIITQHISLRSIKKVNSSKGAATMDNLLAKFNLKAFGLNYTIVPAEFATNEWFGSTLIMGYDVCHPTNQSVGERALEYANDSPSIVGFSHNATKGRDLFVGDFAYQEPLRERVEDQLLNGRMKWILRSWEKYRGSSLPEAIFVYRDGVSEGQSQMVLGELSALSEACDEYSAGYKPNFVVIIVTKRHNKRFFKEDNGGQLLGNPDALTVVDRDVVRTDITEMYIQSHVPLQGTAKPTQYTLLHSSIPAITQDLIQDFTIALTFQHQICAMPVSIPEPVYQSDEWAKRGSEILKVYKEYFKLPRRGGPENDKKIPIDWHEMTKRLSYMDKRLDGIRTNA